MALSQQTWKQEKASTLDVIARLLKFGVPALEGSTSWMENEYCTQPPN